MSTHHQDHKNYEEEGWDLMRQKKYDLAVKSFDNAIKRNQKIYFAYFGKGECLLKLEDYDKSMECFAAAQKIDDKHPWAYHGIGRAHFFKGNYQSAIAYFDKSIDIEPHGKLAWYWKGRALIEVDDYKQAESSLKMALSNAVNTNEKLELIPDIEYYLKEIREKLKTKSDTVQPMQQVTNNINIGPNAILNRVAIGANPNKCPKCGAQLQTGEKFCSNCGERISQ